MMTETTAPETVLEAPVATTEQVATPTDATAAPADEPKQVEPKTFTQEELDAKVQARLAKAERQHLRELREITQQIRQPQQEPQEDAPPQRDKFATDEQWLDARDEWRDAKRERASQQQRAQEAQRETATKTEKLYQAAEKLPGFDRETFDGLPLTPAIAKTVVESEKAPQLMAYLTSNPEVVERISRLSHERQAAELGRIEERLAVVRQTKEPPAPIRTVAGGGSVSNGDLSSMPIEEYIAMRKKQGARWAR